MSDLMPGGCLWLAEEIGNRCNEVLQTLSATDGD
jgi:hypothetical protein